jgi:VRR-NUC domain
MTRRARPEQQLQRAVLDHLRWRAVPNTFAFHPANGGWRSAIEAQILKSQGVVAGVPDVIIVHGGRTYGLELKADSGRLSDAQRQCHEQMRAAGADVAVAHGIDQALAQLEGWNLLRHDVAKAPRRAFAGNRNEAKP